MKKITLDKNKTAMLMAIKGHEINIKDIDKYSYFKYGTERDVLNNYKELCIIYADIAKISVKSVYPEHIIRYLLNIIDTLTPCKVKDIVVTILCYSKRRTDMRKEVLSIFYSYIKNIRLINDFGEEIYDLDYSKVTGKGLLDT